MRSRSASSGKDLELAVSVCAELSDEHVHGHVAHMQHCKHELGVLLVGLLGVQRHGTNISSRTSVIRRMNLTSLLSNPGPSSCMPPTLTSSGNCR